MPSLGDASKSSGAVRLHMRFCSSFLLLSVAIMLASWWGMITSGSAAVPQLAGITAVATVFVSCAASGMDLQGRKALDVYTENAALSSLFFWSIVCALSAWHIEDASCGVLLKGIAAFVMPIALSREDTSSEMLFSQLAVHFVVVACVLRNSLFDDGWQYLAALFLVDVVLLDGAQHQQDLVEESSGQAERTSAVVSSLQHMMSMICDGSLATTSSGALMGADKKAMYLLGIDERIATCFVASSVNIADLVDGTSGPTCETGSEVQSVDSTKYSGLASGEASIDPGLKTMRLRNMQDGSWLECEVYTVAVSVPTQALPVLLGYTRMLPNGGELAKWYIMSLRVTQEGADPIGFPSRIAMSECTSPPLSPRSMAGQGSAVGDQPHRRPTAGEDTWGKTQAVCMGVGVGDYTKVRIVARGSQALVYEARDADGERFALKEISLKGIVWQRDFPKQLREADREARILKSLRWASGVIVRLEEAWIHSDFSQACLVMEFLPHTLAQVLMGKRQSGDIVLMEDCGRWLTQMSCGLAAIHRQKVLHRDIKPSNVLMTEDLSRCKIADLGVSRPMRTEKGNEREDASIVSGRLDSVVSFNQPAPSIFSTYTAKPGTKAYASPEGVQDGGDYGCETDVFSLGCVLLEMLTLEKVPEKNLGAKMADDMTDHVYDSIVVRPLQEAGLFKYAHYTEFEDYSDICARMLRKRPQFRASLRDVMASPTLAIYVAELADAEPKLQRVLLGEDDMDHRSMVSEASLLQSRRP